MKRLLIVVGGLSALLVAGAATAAEPVTIDNFPRVESDFYFKGRADAGCFGKFCHNRNPPPVDNQGVIRANRDTLYSYAILDLTTPATITMPDAGKRFQSIVALNEDHYIKHVGYEPGSVTLDQAKMGSRYAHVAVRIFVDPNDPADIEEAHRLQDAIKVVQNNPGNLELPDWNQDQRQKLHNALLQLGPFVADSRGMFGDKPDVDEVRHLLGTAGGWGGNREQDGSISM